MKIEYNPNHSVSYNSFRCPECHNEFFGGGRALHKKGCTMGGYNGCICVIGPKVVTAAKEWAKREGEERRMPLCPLSFKDIKEQLPELLMEELTKQLLKTTDHYGNLMPSFIGTSAAEEAKKLGFVEDYQLKQSGTEGVYQRLTEAGKKAKEKLCSG